MRNTRSQQALETARALNELTKFPEDDQEHLYQVVEDWFTDINDRDTDSEEEIENENDSDLVRNDLAMLITKINNLLLIRRAQSGTRTHWGCRTQNRFVPEFSSQ